MRDLEFDDALWREAIAAFRVDEPIERLRDRTGAYASIVEELVDEAAGRPVLVGFRLASPGKNPRLLALLTAAFLARAGHDTLFVDLGADVRWLEATLDRDFKEGIVDHLQYGVPIEQCLRPTGMEGLTALSGGAYFLAGSPLDDAPGIRATLERLRREHRVVVVALPPPVETADAAGVTALCGAVLTVAEEGVEPALAGNERAVIRLTGDPRAAGDLARWTRRFVGPLPALLAGRSDRAEPVRRASAEAEPAPEPVEARAATRRSRRPAPPPGDADRRRPGRAVATGVAAALALAALGFAGWTFVSDGDDGSRVAVEPVGTPVELALGGGTAVPAPGPEAVDVDPGPLEPEPGFAADDSAASATDSVFESTPTPVGQPVPWSVHVGSYLSTESGGRLVDRIVETGELAFLVPVDLPGKGRWHRVYVGAYADSAAAARALDRLVESDLVDEGVIRSAPMAFRLGVFEHPTNAERARDALRRRGVPAYVMGEDPVRVWAGGYESRAEAEPLARALAGTDTEWTLRRR